MPNNLSIVCVVEDDTSTRKALKRLIETLGFEAHPFETAQALLGSDVSERADCILLDINLPDIDGLTVQKLLQDRGSHAPVVFLTGHGDVPMSVRAMRGGALDFLLKPVDEHELTRALSKAVSVSIDEAEKVAKIAQARSYLQSLTPRESDVLRCVLTGAMNKQIANHLGIAEKTVKVHRGRLMEKLQAKTVIDLIAIAGMADFAADPDLKR